VAATELAEDVFSWEGRIVLVLVLAGAVSSIRRSSSRNLV
jgi:hypothetical protein